MKKHNSTIVNLENKDPQPFQQTNIRPPLMNPNIGHIRPNQCQMLPPNSPRFLQHQMRSQNQHAALNNPMPVRHVIQAQAESQPVFGTEWYDSVYKKFAFMKQSYVPYLLKYHEYLEQRVLPGDRESASRNEREKLNTTRVIDVINSPKNIVSQSTPAKVKENLKKIEEFCSHAKKLFTIFNEQRLKNLACQRNDVTSARSPKVIHNPTLQLNESQISQSTPPRTNIRSLDPNIPTLKLNAPRISKSTQPRTNFVSSDPNTSPLDKRTNQSPTRDVFAVSVASTKKTAESLTSENQKPMVNAVTSILPKALTAPSADMEDKNATIINSPPLARETNQSPPSGICTVSEKISETLTPENERPLYIERLANAGKSASSEVLIDADAEMESNTVTIDQPSTFSLPYNNNKRRHVSDVESTLASTRPRFSGRRYMLQEIQEINCKLVETSVELDSNSYDKSDGTHIKISYVGYGFAQIFKVPYLHNMPNISTRLLVPADYPNSSPIVLDSLNDASSLLLVSENAEDVTEKGNTRFSLSLRKLPELYSIAEIARIWDACARTIFKEYSDAMGANCLSSRYGDWEYITSS